MRIVFIGAVEFSRRALQRLLELKAEIVSVCTLRESKFNADHVDLSEMCSLWGVPWTYTPDINCDDSAHWIAKRRPDVIFCFGWSRLLKPTLLKIAPLGVIGFHPAALPCNRGRHPIIWALALGLKETASTFFFMNEDADAGDILSQQRIGIDESDNAGTLYEKVTASALCQIEDFLPHLESGDFTRIPQANELASTWRKRCRLDGQIDWRMSARSIYNLVRALTEPYGGAHFVYQGRDIKVWQAQVILGVALNIEPGRVVELTSTGPIVKCGEDAVRLYETQPIFEPKSGEYL